MVDLITGPIPHYDENVQSLRLLESRWSPHPATPDTLR